MGEVCHPRACSLKQLFVTGREGSEENLRQKPQGAAVFLKVRELENRSEMSGTSPKHTKSRRYKACLPGELCKQLSFGGDKEFGKAGPTWVRHDALRPIPEPEPYRCSENTLHRGPGTPASTADRREELPKASRLGQVVGFKWELLLIQHSANIC